MDIRLPFSPLPPLMRVYGAVVYPVTLSFQSPSNPPGLLLLSSPYSMEKEECFLTDFFLQALFRFRRHEGTRLLEEDWCVCVYSEHVETW